VNKNYLAKYIIKYAFMLLQSLQFEMKNERQTYSQLSLVLNKADFLIFDTFMIILVLFIRV
jgi:hypothetical protein